jgi:hypothetical protein
MPSPKDRQNSGISILEKEQAAELLNNAIKSVYANIGPSPVLVQIRSAMVILGMKETR